MKTKHTLAGTNNKALKKEKGARKMKIIGGFIAATLVIAAFLGVAFIQDTRADTDEDTAMMQAPGPAWGLGNGMGRPGGPMMGMGPMMGAGMCRPPRMGGPRARGHRGMMRGPMMGRMNAMRGLNFLADKLDLTADQKNEIGDILASQQKDIIKKNADLALAQVDLRKLLGQDDPDLNAVKEEIQRISGMQAEIIFSQIKTRIDVKNVLTEKQQKALEQLRQNAPQRFQSQPAQKNAQRGGRGFRGARRGQGRGPGFGWRGSNR